MLAESEIQKRQRELSQDHGGTPEESRAFSDAMHRLILLRKNLSKKSWFQLGSGFYCIMPKRSLRVVKWLGTIPAVGVCTSCDRLFTVPLTTLKSVADAQESLRVQFAEHKCKSAQA